MDSNQLCVFAPLRASRGTRGAGQSDLHLIYGQTEGPSLMLPIASGL